VLPSLDVRRLSSGCARSLVRQGRDFHNASELAHLIILDDGLELLDQNGSDVAGRARGALDRLVESVLIALRGLRLLQPIRRRGEPVRDVDPRPNPCAVTGGVGLGELWDEARRCSSPSRGSPGEAPPSDCDRP
jgi:hypothetical protein